MIDPQPYHHVDLRKTLLEAAVALIGEAGPRGFTLREVARRAGVSHNAPYRHFAGKDELLVAVAQEGFGRLTAVRCGAGQVSAQGSLVQTTLSFASAAEISVRTRRKFLPSRP